MLQTCSNTKAEAVGPSLRRGGSAALALVPRKYCRGCSGLACESIGHWRVKGVANVPGLLVGGAGAGRGVSAVWVTFPKLPG